MSENDSEKKQEERALEELQAGYDAHQKGELDAALKHFSKAMELDNENISCITNRMSVYFDMRKYKECLEDCIRVEEKEPKWNVDVELRAMVLSLKGSSYIALANCAKDCDLAIEALDMACKLEEKPIRLSILELARHKKEEFERREHLLGDQEKDLGTILFEKSRIEAVKHYTRAIELNPCDVKAHCSRALCYMLDGMLAEALKDAESSLELDPTFVRGYLLKGDIEFEKKEYSKALETYEMGRKHDAENEELIGAISKCREQMPTAADKDTVMESHEALKGE